MGQKVVIIFFTILALSFLVIFCRFLSVNGWFVNLDVDNKLVPVDVFSLLVSAAVTIWVGYYIVKKLSEQRFEKEILINDLRLIEQEIGEIESCFETSESIDISYVSSKINTIRRLLDRLIYTIRLSEVDCSNDIQKIYASFNRLYLATTNFESNIVNRNSIDTANITYSINQVIYKVRKLTLSINTK